MSDIMLSTVLYKPIIKGCIIKAKHKISIAAVIDIESSFSTIPKEEVIKLIKTQGTKSPYYFEGLSYKVANIE